MTSTSKPTVLFVHGSWHTPAHFGPIRTVFENAGFATSCPLQPNIGSLPPISVMEDAQCIREELNKQIKDEGNDVIVVAHSYGGVVTAQAVDKEFAKKEREREGHKGGVLRLVYMCAFILPIGDCIVSALGGKSAPFIYEEADGMSFVHDPKRTFYHDLSAEDQEKWTKELRKCPRDAQYTCITQAAYVWHPLTYLFCENDQALPLRIQQMMVDKARGAGAQIETESCKASHSPFLSMPERVLQLVEKSLE